MAAVTLACFILIIVFLWPEDKKISAPAIVATSDAGKLIPLKISIVNDHDLLLRFDLYDWLYMPWTDIRIQKVTGAKNITLRINGKSSDSLENKIKARIFNNNEDAYIHLDRATIAAFFDLKAHNEFYVEYVFKDGLYHRNYAGSFISLVYLPVDLSQKKDSIFKSDVDVQIVTPHNYIVTSSIPEAKTIFVLEDGVYYSFGFKRKQTGILINLENESASAFRDIMMLFITTVFGFTLGSLIEKYAARLKK
jgi:hypothetical protein